MVSVDYGFSDKLTLVSLYPAGNPMQHLVQAEYRVFTLSRSNTKTAGQTSRPCVRVII